MGIHNGTLDALGMHFQPGHLKINGLDPVTDQNAWDQLCGVRPGDQCEVAADTGLGPQTDRDAVHIARGIIEKGGNPWMKMGVPREQQLRLPIERYNDAANAVRAKFLGLPPEGGNQVAASAEHPSGEWHEKTGASVAVSVDMTVTSKWQVVALGELQQPGGVGATQPYNPVVDGPNPDGPDFGDNAGNSPEQEVALETWVNTAVDLLNRGQDQQAIIAQLAHDGCPNPQEVMQRALQQPEGAPISDTVGQDPFDAPAPPDPSQAGQMEGLSQQPPVQASRRVRIVGTTMIGTEIDRWEGMWGEGTVKVALDGGGTMNVAPEALQSLEEASEKHPVTEIQQFIDSIPEVLPTRPHIEARLANLELVRRAVRSTISKVGFSDQLKLQQMDTDAENEAAGLNEILANFHEGYEIAYAKAARRYEFNALKLATGEVTEWAGYPKEAGAIWATENFDIAVADDDSFVSAAAHFASAAGMTGTQFTEFLAGAEEHRKVRTEEFTATEPEITDNDGPAEALFI